MGNIDVPGLAGESTLKVLHVIIDLDVGGAELMLKRIVLSHQHDPSIAHCVVSLTTLGVIGKELQDAGIKVYTLNMRSMFHVVSTFVKLCNIIKSYQPEVVHTWMYHSDLIGGIAARVLGIKKVIWCVRSTDIHKGGSKVTLLVRKVCALISKFVPALIICAADLSRKVHEQVGYEPSKMHVIPNGFDPKTFNPQNFNTEVFRATLNINPSDIVVTSIGRYSPVKDHLTFIRAAGILAASHQQVRFVMIGRGVDSNNKMLNQAIDETQWREKFILLGERHDIPACLNASDIFCLHSLTEGFPNVLGEAMVSGKACVTTDVGDAAYLLDDDKYVVVPGNAEMLASTLSKLVEQDAETRDNTGSRLKQRILDNFTLHAISQAYLTVYKKIENE